MEKTVFKDENLEIMLNTNCLLRRGKIRNFKLNQISEVREIIKGETIFENSLSENKPSNEVINNLKQQQSNTSQF